MRNPLNIKVALLVACTSTFILTITGCTKYSYENVSGERRANILVKTFKVQAPYDSFVCFNKSFAQCEALSQDGMFRRLQRISNKTGALAIPDLSDPLSGQQIKSADGRYGCDYGMVPYKLNLDADRPNAIVFVSPVLLSQLVDDKLRVDRMRESCKRALEAYDFQISLEESQTDLANKQWTITVMSSAIEKQRFATGPFPVGGDTALMIQGCEFNERTQRECLEGRRTSAASAAETMRRKALEHAKNYEYSNQIEDLNIQIQQSLRQLARSMFALDRASEMQLRTVNNDGYADGTWVEQGTVFLGTR